jgi:hypothetical protein
MCLKRLYLLSSSIFRSLQRLRTYLAQKMTMKHMTNGITIAVMGSIMTGGRVAFGF